MRLAVTAANSTVGRNLLRHIAKQDDVTVTACVRTERAVARLPAAPNIQPVVVGYDDDAALARALEGAEHVVHLAGVLFESRGNSYRAANVETTRAIVAAARRARVGHMVFVSALGADPGASNEYLQSKGASETLVLTSGLAATALRTPVLLGPDSAAGSALIRSAARGLAFAPGGGRHTVRPLDTDDLSRAILHVCRHPPEHAATHELVGPEPVRYRDLIRRTAAAMGKNVRILPVPVWSMRLLAGANRRVTRSGISPAVVDVITADEVVSHNAADDLGIALTPLSTTIGKLTRTACRNHHD
jgi:uncharacterized protein YbjT (DUF2867 family)